MGIDRRRDPVHDAIAAELASLAHWGVAGPARHGFKPSRPSVGSAPKDEGENPRAVTQITTQPSGRWDNAGRSTAPAPQSKPVTVAYRLVAQRYAIGGNWASAENPGRRASVYDSTPIAGVYVNQTSKGLLRLVRGRGHRLISRQRPGPSSTELAHRGIVRCRAQTTRRARPPRACPAARTPRTSGPRARVHARRRRRRQSERLPAGRDRRARSADRSERREDPWVSVDLQLVDDLDLVEANDLRQSPQTLRREAPVDEVIARIHITCGSLPPSRGWSPLASPVYRCSG